MASAATASSFPNATEKKTCDNCKAKKISCTFREATNSVWHYTDGGSLPERCLNCSIHLIDCTFTCDKSKKRRLPKGRIEELEARIKKLEQALGKVCPDKKLLKQIWARLDDDSDKFDSDFGQAMIPSEPPFGAIFMDLFRKITRSSLVPERSNELFRNFIRDASIGPIEEEAQVISFIRSAQLTSRCQKTLSYLTWSAETQLSGRQPWELKVEDTVPVKYTFPPKDLMDELVDAYFKHANLFLPLLHRPTFDRSVAEGLHLRDSGFGGVLLLVCALGSKYIPAVDERVMLDGVDSPLSAGYRWFNQVNYVKDLPLSLPTLYDVQMFALVCQFIQGTSLHHSCWTIAATGISVSRNLRIQWQRRVPLDQLTVEHELCKRAFWVLIALDRMYSISFGRTCTIDKREVEADMPIECDDEYWENEDPQKRFRQHPGEPSTISAFNHLLKLGKIVAYTIHSVYHIRTAMWDAFMKGWEKPVVEELDSALNKWLEDVPESVRWDPHTANDDKFYRLSLTIMGWYHYIQILIHRPFILSQDKKSHLFPSLTICSNAARATCNLVDIYRKKGYPMHVYFKIFAFTAGVVLTLNRSSAKQGVDDVYKCLDFLKAGEERWYAFGQAWDTLYGLVNAQDRCGSQRPVRGRINNPRVVSKDSVHDTIAAPRRTDHVPQLSHGDSPSETDSSHHSPALSNRPAAASTPEWPAYAVPQFLPSTAGSVNSPKGIGDIDPIHNLPYLNVPYTMPSDTSELPSSFSNDFGVLPMPSEYPDTPPDMDHNTVNMWMNAPTGISLEDWVDFLGDFGQGEGGGTGYGVG